MAARLLLLGLAVVGAAVAIHALHADHRCAEVKATAAEVPLSRPVAVARAAADRCGDPRDHVLVETYLLGRGRRGDAAALARQTTIQSPGDYLGWLALGRLAGDRRALARAHDLNPRAVPAPR
jgi:hypothetical protein